MTTSPAPAPAAGTPAAVLIRYTMAAIVARRHDVIDDVEALRLLAALGWSPAVSTMILNRWRSS